MKLVRLVIVGEMDGAQIRRGAKNLVGVAKEEGDLAMKSGEARERKSTDEVEDMRTVDDQVLPAFGMSEEEEEGLWRYRRRLVVRHRGVDRVSAGQVEVIL